MIQIREAHGASGGEDLSDNPFDWNTVRSNIERGLFQDGFTIRIEYGIMLDPNIVNITYGRGVGYSFEEEIFDKSISEISATKIRQEMRQKGAL